MAYTKFKPLTQTYIYSARLDIKEDIPKEIDDLLAPGERILVGAKNNKYMAMFTNKRMIIVDPASFKMGTEHLSISYTSISSYKFSSYKSHSSLRMTLNNSYPIKLRFIKDYDNITVKEIYRTITEHK